MELDRERYPGYFLALISFYVIFFIYVMFVFIVPLVRAGLYTNPDFYLYLLLLALPIALIVLYERSSVSFVRYYSLALRVMIAALIVMASMIVFFVLLTTI